MNIKGAIFDFDGVIVDSERRWPAVENPYIQMHTVGWSDDLHANLIGMGLDEVYEYLASQYAFSVTKEQYFADYERLALSLYGDVVLPLPGIIALLDAFSARGIRMGIASSSKPTWIKLSLEKHGMSEYFHAITSSHDDDIAHGKPAPDVFRKALAKQLLPANEVIAIEDSKNGIIAATAAGLFSVGVNIENTNSQDISNANLQISAYSELLSLFK
jgi:HAD superfamily hydrolase (TIGR01509 family)